MHGRRQRRQQDHRPGRARGQPASCHRPRCLGLDPEIAGELELGASDVLAVTVQLRGGLVTRTLTARLEGEVKIGEAYVEAGHKGQPAAGCTT